MSGHRRSITHSGSPSSSRRGTARPSHSAGPSQEQDRIQVWLKPKADGSGFELEPSKIVLQISKRAYMSRMTECWPRWSNIPPGAKNAIWEDFLAEVDLGDADSNVVQRHWNSKIARNYRETVNGMKTAGKKPNWMGANVWEDFRKWWENEDFLESSERNSANRSKNPVTHRGGSKSFQHHREDLERQRGGPVSCWDVFTHTHALSQTDGTGNVTTSWDHCDKAHSSYETFMQARTVILGDTGRDELTPDEEDAIFASIMDAPAHGRRFGFGNLAALTPQQEYQKAQDKEEIAELKATVASQGTMIEELNQRLTQFVEQYGQFPSSGGSGAE